MAYAHVGCKASLGSCSIGSSLNCIVECSHPDLGSEVGMFFLITRDCQSSHPAYPTYCSSNSCSPDNCRPQHVKSLTYLASSSRSRPSACRPKLVPSCPTLPTKLPLPNPPKLPGCHRGGEILIAILDEYGDDPGCVAPNANAENDNGAPNDPGWKPE